jgi:hypothetical protein
MVREQQHDLPAAIHHSYRWRDWALGIEGANELAPIESYLAFVDTSEIVEYVLPSSILGETFPTRLDVSLDLLFRQKDNLFIFGPHATELNGVRESWQERMYLVEQELKRLREHWLPDKKTAEANLAVLSQAEFKVRVHDLVRLLSRQLRIFAAWRVPYNKLPAFFDGVMDRLLIPGAAEMDLPFDWRYRPDRKNVDTWMERLDDTEKGYGEAGPNLVDAYALDQLQQIADSRQSGRIPILFTHSGKIVEALRTARERDREFFRVDGVSLVQPPQTALVLSLLRDADNGRTPEQLSSELERERERCEQIVALSEAIKRTVAEGQPPSDLKALERELAALESLSSRWDALQKIRQATDAELHTRTPLLESLQKMLNETTSEDDKETFDRVLGEEIDKLIHEINRLQEKVASRAPLVPKTALAVDATIEGELTASVGSTLVSSKRRAGGVPSAAYPVGFFRFRDPEIIPCVREIHDALDRLKNASTAKERRASLIHASVIIKRLERLSDRPEYYLLTAVICLVQEKWLEGSDRAAHGLTFIRGQNADDFTDVECELLLARACADRAHVLSTRVHVRSIAKQFLDSAVESCLKGLELQDTKDARLLRELAVILASSCQPVFGPNRSLQPLSLTFDRQRLAKWAALDGDDDTLAIAGKLARKANTLNRDSGLSFFFINTHLYVMADIDRRRLVAGLLPVYERERLQLAKELIKMVGRADPNFVDTIMWNEYVMAAGLKKRGESWQRLAREATELSKLLKPENLTNRFYQRLIMVHQRFIQPNSKRPRRIVNLTARS